MAGVLPYRRIQLGKETTDAGTAVAATAAWRGLGTIEDQRETVFAEEAFGVLARTDHAYTPRLLASIEFESTPATFEQILHVLEASVEKIGTGVADGGGTGKIYDYDFPTTAPNEIQTYTIEGGDDNAAEEMEYSFVDQFTLSGTGGEAVMLSATWLGRQSSTCTFTPSTDVTVPAVEEILFSKGKLYIDPDSTGFGITQKSNTLMDMSLTVRSGWRPVWTADGALYFSFIKCVAPEVTLSLTFEHDATAVAEIAAWRAHTARCVRLIFEGSALGTAGAYTYKTLKIDLAGKWERFEKIGERDGNDIVTGTLRGTYNTTLAVVGEIVVVNLVTAVP